MARHFLDGNIIGFDTETTGLLPWQGDRAFAFSFCNENHETAYFELDVDPFTRKVIPDASVLDPIRQILGDPKIEKVAHNMAFDRFHMEVGWDIPVNGKLHDSVLLAHICNPLEPTFELKKLCVKYGLMDDADEKILRMAVNRCRNRARKRGWKVAIEEKNSLKEDKDKAVTAADYWVPGMLYQMHPDECREGDQDLCEIYAVKDAIRTMSLKQFYEGIIDLEESRHVYENLEQPLMEVVYKMRGRGVRIDLEQNERDIEAMKVRGHADMASIIAAAWPEFNIDSPIQMRKLLFEKLGLPANPDRTTTTGMQSVDADTLVELKKETEHPTVSQILKYRGASKAYSYFCRYRQYACKDRVVPGTMVLHPDIRQLKPSTGRFSMANPNMQQVTSEESSRSPDPIDARGSFGPRKGYAWLHNDYKGMEVRVFADVAQEPNMLRAIAEGREIHDEVCDRGWGGKNNPGGIDECIHVLGLDGSENFTRPEHQALFKEWGVRDWKSLSHRNRADLVCHWLDGFNWSIVKAQASVGLKVTKNKGKMVTFCKMYGGAAGAIADLLHMPVPEAQKFLNQYDKQFPRIRQYSAELQEEVLVNGYITTRWGRRLPIRKDLSYQCVNYMVQGSSADLLKSAMLKTDRYLDNIGIDGHLVLCVHDELIFEIKREELTYPLIRKICSLMEETDGNLNVPMPTDPSIAWKNWRQKQKVKL